MTSERDDTVQLLRGWHAGDRAALEALIRENLPWIAAHVRGRLRPDIRNEAETMDFVQEAMLEVFEDGPRFEVASRAHFRGLFARIVENNIRDKVKWMHRQRRDRRREKGDAGDTVLKLDPPVRAVTTPSECAARNERQAWLRLALELLGPEDREVLRLREWEGLTFAEIGRHMGTGEEAARKRYHRALPKLAERVGELRGGRLSQLLDAGEGG